MHRSSHLTLLFPGPRRVVLAAAGLALLAAVVPARPASAASGWAIQPTPNPAGATVIDVTAASCTSATACTAVGYYGNSSGTTLTLAERWNGTSWTIKPSPNPTAAPASAFYAVSCTSATACTAAGSYANSSGIYATLAERWNGTSWAIQPTPNPQAGRPSYFYGMSCASASACTAVGYYSPSSGGNATLAERWNGTAWAIQATPNATPVFNFLYAASCTLATACTAVGYSVNSSGAYGTLAEHEGG
jgi:hypothetical protein